ncbi:MAG TPA: hypothetical protein VM925_31595, partial [Labilithrix sp.]|nr:hypothetical protein [Labilithrix sp.]
DLAKAGDLVGALGPLDDKVGILGLGAKSYWSLSPDFFASAKYPNTLVYADACSSAEALPASAPDAGAVDAGPKSTSLKDAFRKNGAGAFIGWEASVSARLANPVSDQIFDALAPKVMIESIKLTVPKTVAVGVSYVPTASVTPPQAGVELALFVSGTDGYNPLPQRRVTDAAGNATFDAVPGAGETGIKDNVTITAGGANNAPSAAEAVTKNPTLQSYRLAWLKGDHGAARLSHDTNPSYNLVCASPKHTKTEEVVKFQ